MNICAVDFKTMGELNEFVNRALHKEDVINIQFLDELYIVYYWD